MPDATLSQLLTRLNIKARDGSNVTFTAQEKTDALTTAVADPYVIAIQRDASQTTTSTLDHYTVPDGMTLIKLGIQINTYGRPTVIEGWDVFDQIVYLDDLPVSGKTLVMIGRTKLTIYDSIPDNRQEYVLVLAKLELVKYLQQSLANTFLTNDMTMGDLIQLESVLSREADSWRKTFQNQVIEL